MARLKPRPTYPRASPLTDECHHPGSPQEIWRELCGHRRRARAARDRRDASSVRDRADRCGARRAGGRVPGDDGPPARRHRGAARRVAVDARGLHPRPRDARRFGHVSHRRGHVPDEARSRQPRGLRRRVRTGRSRGALGPVSMRMRLQNVTAFMAEALGPALDFGARRSRCIWSTSPVARPSTA